MVIYSPCAAMAALSIAALGCRAPRYANARSLASKASRRFDFVGRDLCIASNRGVLLLASPTCIALNRG